jgi:Membrane-bound lytic murein transglycosylase B
LRLLLLVFVILNISHAAFAQRAKVTIDPNEEWTRKELTKIGLSKSFTEESIENYEPKGFNTVVTLNLLGFLQPSGAHLLEVTPKAVKRATSFIQDNQTAFAKAHEEFSVPADVISSLLWIETRHGEDVGTFHTVSVYLHLLQAKRAANIEALTKMAIIKNKQVKKYTSIKELRKIMRERAIKKSKWAEEQLIALASIRKNKHLDITKLRGSYAGAFGLPQFIPSSYRDFAVSHKPKATPNLSKPADAIMSVASYLSQSGWDSKSNDAQVAALMKYNFSRDYADGILRIAKRLPANLVPQLSGATSSAETGSP